MPLTPDQLLARLADLGIETTTVDHPPVFTVEQAKAHRGELNGVHIKNLFLRNKKGKMWLVVALEDRKIDLKELGVAIGAGKVSFGSEQRLMSYLGVTPGSVTPFGVINDTEKQVTLFVDDAVLQAEVVNAHPLTNEKTTTIKVADLRRFLEAEGHPPQPLVFDQ